MFILRKLLSKNTEECNIILGDSYNVIQFNNELWESHMELWETFRKDIYAFISYNEGKDILPLYRDQPNYIMTSNGQTFANLTVKTNKTSL